MAITRALSIETEKIEKHTTGWSALSSVSRNHHLSHIIFYGAIMAVKHTQVTSTQLFVHAVAAAH